MEDILNSKKHCAVISLLTLLGFLLLFINVNNFLILYIIAYVLIVIGGIFFGALLAKIMR